MKTRHEYSSTRVEFPPPHPPPGGLKVGVIYVRSFKVMFPAISSAK